MAKDELPDLTAFTRLVKFAPDDDLTLVLLKGHLVIEEQLVSLLKAKKTKAKGTFSKKLKRVGKVYSEEHAVWASIEKLNKVRNHLAHNLEAPKLEAMTKDFIDSIDKVSGYRFPRIQEHTKKALIYLCGQLTGMKP
jgi:hypothetical protein